MKTHLAMVLGVVVSVMLVACTPTEENPTVATIPRAVRTKPIASPDLSIMIKAVGRLIPDREVAISAQVSGIMMQYNADIGSKVNRGALLAKLDGADYTLALKEAEANLLSARIRLTVEKNAYARAKNLLPDKAITPEQYDQADSRTNTFAVEFLVDNPDFLLKAGLTARVAIQTDIRCPHDSAGDRPVQGKQKGGLCNR